MKLLFQLVRLPPGLLSMRKNYRTGGSWFWTSLSEG